MRKSPRPKKQQGFQLPEEAIEALNDLERRTGATLSRIALAAFCCYFNRSDPEQSIYMRLALMVEKGELAFRDVHLTEIVHHVRSIQFLLSRPKLPEDQRRLLESDLRKAEARLEKYLQTRVVE